MATIYEKLLKIRNEESPEKLKKYGILDFEEFNQICSQLMAIAFLNEDKLPKNFSITAGEFSPWLIDKIIREELGDNRQVIIKWSGEEPKEKKFYVKLG